MYICPTCNRNFENEDAIRKHFLNCWKEQHPYHQSTSAPHTEDVIIREVDDNVLDFFAKMRVSR